MECLPDDNVSCEQLLGEVSDAQLVHHLCRSGEVFSDWYPSLRESNACDLCDRRPLLIKGPDGQNCFTGLPRRICRRRLAGERSLSHDR